MNTLSRYIVITFYQFGPLKLQRNSTEIIKSNSYLMHISLERFVIQHLPFFIRVLVHLNNVHILSYSIFNYF
jgi:hypothetical protein